MNKFKRWFWSAHVQDQFRSSTVDILWIALTLADGNLVDLLIGIYSGDPAVATVSGASLLLSRIIVRTTVLYALKKAKAKFPGLSLPRDFAFESTKEKNYN